MSFINDFLEKITGLDLDGSDSKETAVVERPCANCPSNCAIAGTACAVCQPYKKKLGLSQINRKSQQQRNQRLSQILGQSSGLIDE